MENQAYSGKGQGAKGKCGVIPEVFYPAAEADKLLEMISPVLGESRQIVAENAKEFPLLVWFLRSFQFCYQEPTAPGL